MSAPKQPREGAAQAGSSSSTPLFADTSSGVHWALTEATSSSTLAQPATSDSPSIQFEDVGTALGDIASGKESAKAGLDWRRSRDDSITRAREAADMRSNDEQLMAERIKLRQLETDRNQIAGSLGKTRSALGQIQRDDERTRARCRKWRKEAASGAASGETSVASRDKARQHVVGRQIRGEWESTRPSPQDLKGRQTLVSHVQSCIDRRFPGTGLKVVAFGSSLTGLHQSSSDVDLVLIDPFRPHGAGTPDHLVRPVPERFQVEGELPEWYSVGLIASLLRRSGHFRNVIPIRGANVPIVEMDHAATDVQADLNINETFGLFNSKLIQAYAELRPALVRPLMSFVKSWAKHRQLNDPAGRNGAASFSSYTLCLLVLQYLQITGDLPNLQSRRLLRALNVEPVTTFRRQPLRRSKGRGDKPPVQLHGFDTTFLDWLELREKSPDRIVEVDGKRSFVGVEDGKEVHLGTHRMDPATAEDADAELGAAAEGFFAWTATLCQSGDEHVSIIKGQTICVRADEEGRERLDDSTPAPPRQDPDGTIYHSFHDGFEVPDGWVQDALVVQDPFIVDRNTCKNAKADMVERLRVESLRAMRLLGRRNEKEDLESSEMEAAVEAAAIEGEDKDEEAKVGPLLYHLCKDTATQRLEEEVQRLEMRQRQTAVALQRCQERVTKLGGDELKDAPKAPRKALNSVPTGPKKTPKDAPTGPRKMVNDIPTGPKKQTIDAPTGPRKQGQNGAAKKRVEVSTQTGGRPAEEQGNGSGSGTDGEDETSKEPRRRKRRGAPQKRPRRRGGKAAEAGSATHGDAGAASTPANVAATGGGAAKD